MILASTLAVREKVASPFLQGNAKVYDGVFDYDSFAISKTFSSKVSNNVYCFSFIFQTTGISNWIINLGDVGGGNTGNKGEVIILDQTFFRYALQNGSQRGNVLDVVFNANFVDGQKYTILLDKQGTTVKAYSYNQGVESELIQSSIVDNLSINTQINLSTNRASIGNRNGSNTSFFKGAIKRLEVLNYSPIATEITTALEQGSMRANSGVIDNDFIFEIDFDKQDGQPLTTFANTPSYTITPFGGSEYVDYQSL